MAGRGPAPKPKAQRRTAHKPQRGEWQTIVDVGWQHGPIPEPPDGLLEATRETWATWFGAWFASHWIPGDVPGLVVTAWLYDQVARGKLGLAGELRQWADVYGVTPKGSQDRRWAAPRADEAPAPRVSKPAHYDHLRVVDAPKGELA